MFTSDPVGDISILTAPVQTEHSIAARITVTGTENTPKYAHIFDFSADFYFCSVPAFSVGGITVGFCTQEPASDASKSALSQLPMGSESVQCNRYVRDDDKGVFLMLATNSKTGTTEIDCISHRSTRKRTRILARFDSESLRQNLKTSRGVLHPKDVSKALSYLSVAVERRRCPICGVEDTGECGCVLPFKRPSHPLDFRNERRNMSLHTGKYGGGSTVRLFSNSTAFIVTELCTKSVIKGSVDRDVIQRLNRYAVQDRMSKLKVNPFAWMMPMMPSVQNAAYMNHGQPMKMDWMSMSPILSDVNTDMYEIFGRTEWDSSSGYSSEYGLYGSNSGNVNNTNSNNNMNNNINNSGAIMGLIPTSGCGTLAEMELDGGHEGSGEGSNSDGKEEDGGRIGVRFEELSAKEQKAELRKQRNRQAAAKSNLKRKVRNERLRKDLKEVHARATMLRATEKRLREENVRLRALANKHKVKISAHLTHIQISNAAP